MNVGRKTKLTKELIAEAERLVRLGNYTNVVCQYLGISHDTWYRWIREGEKASTGLKSEFYYTIRRAEAAAEMRNLNVIQQAASDNWNAAAWFLARKHSDRWGRKDQIQADVKQEQIGEKESTINHKIVTDPTSMELLAQLYRRTGELQEE